MVCRYLSFPHLVDVEPVRPQVGHQQEPALTARARAVEPGAVRVGLVLQKTKKAIGILVLVLIQAHVRKNI